MRIVQAIQSFAALCGAIIITFLQPQRDHIGPYLIATWALLVVSSIWAVSHIVTAVIQKQKRAYISNGILLLFFGAYIFMCADHIINRSWSLSVGVFSGLIIINGWLIPGGLAVLAVAIAHKKFPKIYKDNLITAGIFLVPAIAIIAFPALGTVNQVGLLDASLIFTAVHLGIAAASPAAPKTKA